VKFADDLVVPTVEWMVMEDKNNRITETGRCHGMEMNEEKTKIMKSQGNHPRYKDKKTGECGTFQLFG
jgi:hypothetical protein